MARFEAHFEKVLFSDKLRLFVFERAGHGSFYIEAMGDDTYRRTRIEEQGSEVKPFATFRGEDTELIRVISDELNRFLGKPDETFTRGKLEATERHLADMRSLALKGKV